MVRLHTWEQLRWTRVNTRVSKGAGGIYYLTGLTPTLNEDQLKLLPAVESAIAHNVDASVDGAFYDFENDRRVWIGNDASANLDLQYADDTWTLSSTYLGTSGRALSGLRYHNCVYWGGHLWTIDDGGTTGTIRRYPDYTTTAGATGETTYTPWALVPLGDRMFMIEADGAVYRRNDADNGWDAYWTPQHTVTVLHATAYRDQLCMIIRDSTGHVYAYQVPHYDQVPTDPQLGTATLIGRHHNVSACPPPQRAALYDGRIWVIAEAERELDSKALYRIVAFNGARITTVPKARLPFATHAGLVTWRDKLLLYAATNTATNLYVLHDGGFTAYGSISAPPGTGYTPHIDTLGDELCIFTSSGVHRTSLDTFQTGSVQTPYVHGSSATLRKRLERVTLIATGTATLTLSYRADDDTSWTQISTGSASMLTASHLGIEFYTIQFKAEITATSDIRLASISILYVEEN